MTSLSLLAEGKMHPAGLGNARNPIKNPNTMNRKTTLNPLININSMPVIANRPRYMNTSGNTGRLLSAKEHKLKQVQNQLADAHIHLNELANENRLLRGLQKRMDSAIQRYENSRGELPTIFFRHGEEIRTFQMMNRQLKIQLKETIQKLKGKDSELLELKDEHKHLIMLSKDVNLGEREKLQNQVADLTERLSLQNETINVLQRKVNLETKSYKRQLHAEIAKHRETQLRLNESLIKNEKLTVLLEKKEKLLASSCVRRNSKLNVGRNISKSLGNSKSLLDLALPIKEHSLPESEISIETKSMSSGSTTFALNEKKIEQEMYQKQFSNKILLETKADQNLNDEPPSKENNIPKIYNTDVKDRVESLKAKIKSQNTINTYKSKVNEVLNNDDSDEDASSIGSLIDEELMQRNNLIDEDRSNKESLNFNLNHLNKTIIELEKKASREQNIVQELIFNLCDETIEKAENATKISDICDEVPKNMTSKTRISKEENHRLPEVNNNKWMKKRNSRDLDDEKKKQLLATLKAIDCGEDDGLAIERLKKSKVPSKNIWK